MHAMELPNEEKSSRLEKIAWIQLRRALDLFMNDGEYASALTLAGASEEILGFLLRLEGRSASIDNWRSLIAAIGSIEGEDLTDKEIFRWLNFARNSAKHVFDGQILELTREHAVEILDRAISNWTAFTGENPDVFVEYRIMAHGKKHA